MSHDWGATVPDDLPIEQMIEIRDGLRSGEISISVGAGIKSGPEIEDYLRELTAQLIAAYDRKIQKIRS